MAPGSNAAPDAMQRQEVIGMIESEQIRAALRRTADAPVCDDCLATWAGTSPQQIAQVCQQLAAHGDLDREQGTCTNCRQATIVNSVITSTNVPG
jgi:alkylhydroperoxidase family enzyme